MVALGAMRREITIAFRKRAGTMRSLAMESEMQEKKVRVNNALHDTRARHAMKMLQPAFLRWPTIC